MSRRPLLRPLLVTVLPALAAGGLLAGLGVLDPVHAALLVVVVAAVTFVWRSLDEGDDPTWPPVPDDRRPGARKDLSELGWATFTRTGAVGPRMRARVTALAAARLAEHGVVLDGAGRDREAAERLLGADVVAGLTSRGEASRAQVHRWLGAVEQLAPPVAHVPRRTAPPVDTEGSPAA